MKLPHGRRNPHGIDTRHAALPLMVLTDAKTDESRCINGLHVQTFITNPFGERGGTLITFANGDRVTVTEDFDTVVDSLMGDRVDG